MEPMARNTLHLIPEFRLGPASPETLVAITTLLKHHGVEMMEIAASGRIRVSGVSTDRLNQLADDLRHYASPEVTPPWIAALHLCPGKEACTHTIRESAELAARLKTIELPAPPPAKVKIGIAGCGRCCTSPWLRDIGLIAEHKGWKLLFGGNGGGKPRIADELARGLTGQEAVAMVTACLTVYGRYGRAKMRTARFIELFGIEWFREEIEIVRTED